MRIDISGTSPANENGLQYFVRRDAMSTRDYEAMLRDRITQLRIQQNVSEHRMSLELNKSGSYIRRITNGHALPSVHELFNIIQYFGMSPAEFFVTIRNNPSAYHRLCDRIRGMDKEDLEKVNLFLDWLRK